MRRLDSGRHGEPSTSAALTRILVELLARHGAPQPAVTADGPFGAAFGAADAPTLIATNPTTEPRTVTFRSAGRVLAELVVPPGETVIRSG